MSHPLNLPESRSMITMTCANEFVDLSDFQSHICAAIQHATHYQELVFTDVSSSWGQQAVDSINQMSDGCSTRKHYNSQSKALRIIIMPTEIHDCHQDWWSVSMDNLRANGDLTNYESRQLRPRVGTTLEFQSGPYRGSRKEPDFFLRVDHNLLPTLVIESGWSESWDFLMDDMNLLLVGGNDAINGVIILNWQLHHSIRRVSGSVELYVLDRNGMPVRRQREVIFPIPKGSPHQQLELTRQEVFGRHLRPDPTRNRPPNEMVYLDIDLLRQEASEALQHMCLLPF